jgi:hypothetical protein
LIAFPFPLLLVDTGGVEEAPPPGFAPRAIRGARRPEVERIAGGERDEEEREMCLAMRARRVSRRVERGVGVEGWQTVRRERGLAGMGRSNGGRKTY